MNLLKVISFFKDKLLMFALCLGILGVMSCHNQENIKSIKVMDEVRNKEEKYLFFVEDLIEVRQNGVTQTDFYITNTGNYWNSYYINAENQLYKYINENIGFMLVYNHVVHVDCGKMINYSIFLTDDGKLYGTGSTKSGVLLDCEDDYISTPKLLMEDVQYALCGNSDITVLKKDKTVWTWGTMYYGVYGDDGESYLKKEEEPVKILDNVVLISGKEESHAALLADGTVWTWGYNLYDKCGMPGQGIIEEPICVAQDAVCVWMGKLQINDCSYDRGFNDNMVIKKEDGSLWACGKNIQSSRSSKDQEGIIYTYEFMPCEIEQKPYIIYDGLNTYSIILKEYERALKDVLYTPSKWERVEDTFVSFYRSKQYVLCYSLTDLTGDGTMELILGFLNEGEYSVCAIYAYDKGRIFCVENNMERTTELYGNGVIKTIWGAGGRAYYTYKKMLENSGSVQFLVEISAEPRNWEDRQETGMAYYRSISLHLNEEEEITEEEFNKIIEKYEIMPVKLEWNVVEGFWNL